MGGSFRYTAFTFFTFFFNGSFCSRQWDARSRHDVRQFLLARVVDVLVLVLEFSNVQRFINDLGNGLNFRAKLVLNTMKSESILVRDEIDRDTQVSESA